MRERKRGQVTVFIIIGVLVVAAVVLFFVLRGGGGGQEQVTRADTQDPGSFLESCMEDDLSEAFGILRSRGGVISPGSTLEFKLEGETYKDYTVLCHSGTDDKFCDPQYVPLVHRMEKEIKNSVSETSKSCFRSLKDSFREQGYSISGGGYSAKENLTVDLGEEGLNVNLGASDLYLERTNKTTKLDKFRFDVYTELYGLGQLVNDIVNRESSSGIADTQFLEQINPSYDIEVVKKNLDELVDRRIYVVTHEDSGRKIKFAVLGKEYEL